MIEEEAYAEWTTAYMNDLSDSAFLYIAPGGEKDEDGKTTPRSLRYFPYRDAEGKVDLPHLRNAIAQAPKADLSPEIIASVQSKGRKILEEQREEAAEEGDAPIDEEVAPDRPDAYPPPAQMSDWSAVVHLDEDYGNKNVELARSGTHYGRASDRQVVLSPEDIISMARGYQIIQAERWYSTGAPIGYNHASLSGALDAESTKAAGRILEVYTRSNDDDSVSLMGRVQWTAEATRRIRAGEFDGFSIEAVPPSSARSKKSGEALGEWALIGGTLTNEPFVAGMQPVAASEKRYAEMGLIKLVSETLAMRENSTEAEVLAEVHSLRERADRAEALSEALDTVTTDRDTIKTKFDELAAKETERMLDRACEDGRISAVERERYLNSVQKLGEEEANYTYFAGRIGVTEIGKAGTDAERAPGQSVLAECNTLAEQLVEEESLDSAAAWARAMQIVLSDPTKRAAYEAAALDA